MSMLSVPYKTTHSYPAKMVIPGPDGDLTVGVKPSDNSQLSEISSVSNCILTHLIITHSNSKNPIKRTLA